VQSTIQYKTARVESSRNHHVTNFREALKRDRDPVAEASTKILQLLPLRHGRVLHRFDCNVSLAHSPRELLRLQPHERHPPHSGLHRDQRPRRCGDLAERVLQEYPRRRPVANPGGHPRLRQREIQTPDRRETGEVAETGFRLAPRDSGTVVGAHVLVGTPRYQFQNVTGLRVGVFQLLPHLDGSPEDLDAPPADQVPRLRDQPPALQKLDPKELPIRRRPQELRQAHGLHHAVQRSLRASDSRHGDRHSTGDGPSDLLQPVPDCFPLFDAHDRRERGHGLQVHSVSGKSKRK
jgi:hypothetical protein